jgi:O-methyltransferase involved in polyketide biosynthesis
MSEQTPPEVPAAPRIYDYLSGGAFHFPIDRAVAQQMTSLLPSLPKWLRMLRAFLQKAAKDLRAEGITHFVDLGSGLPSDSHIHAALPDAKVLYVDADPYVVAEGRKMLAGKQGTLYLQGDIREPAALLALPEVEDFLGGARKVAFGLSGVSVFLTPAEMNRVLRELHAWAAPGSRVYTNFETKDPALTSEPVRQFVAMLAATGGDYHFYTIEDCRSAVEPWTFDARGLIPLARYLGKPEGHIGPEDREGVGLEIFGAFLEKR